MKYCIFFFIITLFNDTFCSIRNDFLYDPSFLRDFKKARAFLLQKGFKRVAFKTPDGLTLKGLYLSRPYATCTVIVCAGWIPGRSENMATFYDLVPNHCNILLFEARGRGESEGALIGTFWKYGVNEYNDILGCISCVRHFNQLPIFLCGLCSGAFNATRAIAVLKEKNLVKKLNIRGIIFDSGWGSVIHVSRSIFHCKLEQLLLTIFKMITQKESAPIKKSFPYRCISLPIKSLYNILHSYLLKPLLHYYDNEINLTNSIHTVTIPFLFIHSYDDTGAHIHEAQKLSLLTLNKECWWIKENSFHVRNHILHKKKYSKIISSFINRLL